MGASTSIIKLNKQARKDLRNKARGEYWRAVQTSNAVNSPPPGVPPNSNDS